MLVWVSTAVKVSGWLLKADEPELHDSKATLVETRRFYKTIQYLAGTFEEPVEWSRATEQLRLCAALFYDKSIFSFNDSFNST